MSDSLLCGRRFRTFDLLDVLNREALAIEIDLNVPAKRVIRVLERVVALRGYPKIPKFIFTMLADLVE